jgi:D-alanine-D-alanine ligase
MTKKHVVVLKGGLSAEREVSLKTGGAVAEALKTLGYRVTEVDASRNLAQQLERAKPNVVYNALHGTYGEDGCVPGLLELMGIPYTHSGVLASAVAMDKPMAKHIFEGAGIRCAPGKVVRGKEAIKGHVMDRPYVLKPVANGSSVGVYIVKKGDPVPVKEGDVDPEELLLAEEFIDGKELTVGVLDGKLLGIIEVRPKQGFYDYKNKYTSGMTEYIIPAPIDKAIAKKVEEMAVKAHEVLGCRGVSRADLRFDETKGEKGLYMLEVNTHPGMTATSLVPKMAAAQGISFPELVEKILKTARLDNA